MRQQTGRRVASAFRKREADERLSGPEDLKEKKSLLAPSQQS